MSNRYFYKNRYTLEVDTVELFGSIVIGATGAVAFVKGGGITGAVRNSAGNYTITFGSKYARFFGGDAGILYSSISAISKIQFIGNPVTYQSDVKASKSVTIQCVNFAGAAADPENGSVLSFRMDFRNSSIGRWD